MKETKNILSLFLISILIFIFVGLPKFEIFLKEKRVLDNKKEELNIQGQYFKKLKDIESELVFYTPKLELVDLIISDESIVPSFVYYTTITGQNSGVFFDELSSVSKNIYIDYPGLNEINIDFSLSGSYNDFKNFISTMEKSIKTVKINKVSISSEKNKKGEDESIVIDNYNYNVSITIYYY